PAHKNPDTQSPGTRGRRATCTRTAAWRPNRWEEWPVSVTAWAARNESAGRACARMVRTRPSLAKQYLRADLPSSGHGDSPVGRPEQGFALMRAVVGDATLVWCSSPS